MEQGSRMEGLTAIVVVTLMFGVVVKFLLLLLGLSGPIGLISIVLSAVAGYVCRPKGWSGDLREGAGLITLIAGLAFLGIAYVFFPGYTLPAHDPIAVPVLANVIGQGQLPIEVFEIGTSAATYPPGQPILLSAVGAVLTPVDQLLALKWLVLASVSLIPLTWAWFHYRLLGSESYVLLVICYYFAFFGIERTIGFSIPFAGKNALLFGIFLAPIISIIMINLAQKRWLWPFGGVVLFGLVLVNYSLLHLMAVTVGCTALTLLASRKITYWTFFRLVGMGIICLAFFIGFLAPVFADPRAAPMDFALSNLVKLFDFWRAYGSGLVIYMDADFGILPSPYRGAVLLLSYLIVFTCWKVRKQEHLLRPASVYLTAFIILFLFGLSIIPAGISFDFFRWVAWPLQAGLIATALQALFLRAKSLSRSGLIVVMAAFVAFVGTGILADARVFASVNLSQALSRQDLFQMAKTLQTEGPCYLIGDSVANREVLITVQATRLLDYAEAISDCRYLNGSWIHFGVPGGRDVMGMPSTEALGSAVGVIFLIATRPKMIEYSDTTGTLWSPFGSISGVEVWELNR